MWYYVFGCYAGVCTNAVNVLYCYDAMYCTATMQCTVLLWYNVLCSSVAVIQCTVLL